MIASPFADSRHFETLFFAGLDTLLTEREGLGVYILVLANAACAPGLWAAMQARLGERHARESQRCARGACAGLEPQDDLDVFDRLVEIGLARLGLPETRQAGPWRVSFNPLRALRPPRASGQAFAGLKKPYDAAGFNFARPFLEKEIFWRGELAGRDARLLYNKFPFAPFHGLLVPEPQAGHPQCLTPALHDWVWQVCAASGVPGLHVAYNSLGAGASVNHLHFQSFVDNALPLAAPQFAHHGGPEPYPLPCVKLRDATAAWDAIAALHAASQPYNLVYARDEMLLLPRRAQDDARLPETCRGWGWSEMAGAVTVFSRETYTALDAQGFATTLACFAPD